MEFQQDAAWWNRTEGLSEKAEEAVRQQDQQRRQRAQEAFEEELRRALPQDEAFRQIALLPRPPITAMRKRIGELFPDHRSLVGLNVTLQELVRTIKAEEKARRART